MKLAILIFLLLIFIFSIKVNLHIVNVKDTYKIYMKISKFNLLIPHQKVFAKVIEKEKNKDIKKKKEDLHKVLNSKNLIYNIFSHSILDRIYIKKFTEKKYNKEPINVASYYIFSSQIIAFFHNHFKLVINDAIIIEDNSNYENVDYYLHAHTDVISLFWAYVVTILNRR